jgi:B-cell receptor-associated protein 31
MNLIATSFNPQLTTLFFYRPTVFSASRWNRFFKSKFLSALSRQAQIYFYLVLGVLVIFLLEAIREMQKYSNMGKLLAAC